MNYHKLLPKLTIKKEITNIYYRINEKHRNVGCKTNHKIEDINSEKKTKRLYYLINITINKKIPKIKHKNINIIDKIKKEEVFIWRNLHIKKNFFKKKIINYKEKIDSHWRITLLNSKKVIPVLNYKLFSPVVYLHKLKKIKIRYDWLAYCRNQHSADISESELYLDDIYVIINIKNVVINSELQRLILTLSKYSSIMEVNEDNSIIMEINEELVLVNNFKSDLRKYKKVIYYDRSISYKKLLKEILVNLNIIN
ncbi:hypothetical protein TCON_1443 [Astathelohania contejeani]|uniref:Uncharacterized protein n=1 Tax=Astathelohania contejeani TaxID=164912 RepID=A0ABQ7HYX0_9MICR|nr:hypothetical protein TCON_1443 [Thelohania contejeani]